MPQPTHAMATFDWSSVRTRLEKDQSLAASEWTFYMQHKSWTTRIAWDVADRVLLEKYPELHRLLRMGRLLLQRPPFQPKAKERLVTKAFQLILDIVYPPPWASMTGGGPEKGFLIKSISVFLVYIYGFIFSTDRAPVGVSGDVLLLRALYKDAVKHFPWLCWRRTLRPGDAGFGSPVEVYRDALHRVHEGAVMAAVSPEGTYPDLTNELGLSPRACGRGASSDVYPAIWNCKAGKTQVAVKVFRVTSQAPADYAMKLSKRMKAELDIWSLLAHPHILSLYGMHWISGVPGLVSPWCNNGDISKYLRDHRGPARLAIALVLLEQVALGLEYRTWFFRGTLWHSSKATLSSVHTHSPVIVHGDLKGANILISDDGRALLCDFGLAAIEAAAAETSLVLLSGTSTKGTYRWMAHELVLYDDAELTRESDVWAFGCVLIEILGGRVPFHERTEELQVILAISRGGLPSRAPRIHDRLWTLMLQCWRLIPSDRPCAGSILAEIRAFIASTEWACWISS